MSTLKLLRQKKHEYDFSSANISIFVLVVLHAVGIIGFSSGWESLFMTLTPFNLTLSLVILLLNHQDFNRAFGRFVIACFGAGLAVEIAGVATGIIFGEYHYGRTLGVKVAGVPLTIGMNWLILVYCSGVLLHKFQWPFWLKAALGAAIMTLLDVFMEPVAIRLDFWHWANEEIPFLNYKAWFIISFVLLSLFHLSSFKKINQVAVTLLVIQFAFFMLLNISLF